MYRYEVVLADAIPELVRTYSHVPDLREVDPPVCWDDVSVTDGGIEIAAPFEDEPEDREVNELMNELGATAACVREVQQ